MNPFAVCLIIDTKYAGISAAKGRASRQSNKFQIRLWSSFPIMKSHHYKTTFDMDAKFSACPARITLRASGVSEFESYIPFLAFFSEDWFNLLEILQIAAGTAFLSRVIPNEVFEVRNLAKGAYQIDSSEDLGMTISCRH